MTGVGTRDFEEAMNQQRVNGVYEVDVSEGKKYVLTVPGKLSYETHKRMDEVLKRWARDPESHFLILDGGMTLARVDAVERPQMDEGWQEYFARVIEWVDREKTTQGKLVQALLCARFLLTEQIDEAVAQRGRDVINYAVVSATVTPAPDAAAGELHP